jgi:hypothetical protein
VCLGGRTNLVDLVVLLLLFGVPKTHIHAAPAASIAKR